MVFEKMVAICLDFDESCFWVSFSIQYLGHLKIDLFDHSTLGHVRICLDFSFPYNYQNVFKEAEEGVDVRLAVGVVTEVEDQHEGNASQVNLQDSFLVPQ